MGRTRSRPRHVREAWNQFLILRIFNTTPLNHGILYLKIFQMRY